MVMFWVAILAVSILLYVLLDGFDLGVGILFGPARDEARRHAMLSAVAPVWDGNETWLIVAGVILWGAFPVVYATLFSAFYLPLLLMLAGLILRGVAFEYRYKTERMRWIWDAGFVGGSLVASFIQGLIVGALVEQLPIANGQYKIDRAHGLMPGKYRISITAGDGQTRADAPADQPPGPTGANIISKDRIPPEYNTKSQHEVEVAEKKPNVFDYDIP